MPSARPDVARGALRGARAAVLAVVALALAATAHAAAGGSLPSLPLLALVVVPLAWGAVALTVRPLGPVLLVGALGTSQLVLHEAFMVLSAPACAAGPAASMAGMPGHHLAVSAMTGGCMSHGTAMAGGTTGAGMLVVHAVATVATALLLAHGDALLGSLLVLLRAVQCGMRRLARATALPVPELVGRVRTAWALDHPWLVVLAQHAEAVGRRGPPGRARAAALV